MEARNYQADIRFDGFRTLIGDASFAKVHASSACVIGLGGVGSWVAEALARCGVGTITLVDLDDVCITNINRQLQALDHTVGKPKATILASRLREIDPLLHAVPVTRFFSAQSAEEILTPHPDIVIDCIDRVTNKSLLIASCVERQIKVVTIGSAGDRMNPQAIRIADLARTVDDPLLSYVRKKLRREHRFPRSERRKFGVPAVYSPLPSTASPRRSIGAGGSCNDGLGTAVFVTGAMGFFAASEAIRLLLAADMKSESTDSNLPQIEPATR